MTIDAPSLAEIRMQSKVERTTPNTAHAGMPLRDWAEMPQIHPPDSQSHEKTIARFVCLCGWRLKIVSSARHFRKGVRPPVPI